MKVRDRFDKNRIGDLVCDGAFKYVQNFAVEINGKRVAEYDSLDGVAEDWEDYKPAEPLIKDEKIRKAVRAWAEAFRVTKVYVCGIGDGKEYIELYAQDNGVTDGRIRISIHTLDGVWIGEEYIITELCGEEEE